VFQVFVNSIYSTEVNSQTVNAIHVLPTLLRIIQGSAIGSASLSYDVKCKWS